MLTIARLRPDGGDRSYYERTVASSREDYYAGRGEQAGEWWGHAADALSLTGTIADGDLSAVLRGEDPASGRVLRAPRAGGQAVRTRIDPHTGERETVVVTHHPVAGFDLTFSAPKSVSLLYALGNPVVQAEVAAAHRAAWQDAMRLVEDEACVVRRGTDGAIRERSGLVAAGYQHRTNRDGDPHLHTHVVVANMAPAGDGGWRALDGQLFIRDWRHAAGYVYHARLRWELTRRLGLEWGPVVKGQADLAAFPAGVLAEFSTRRQAVVEHAAAHGSVSYAGRERAQVVTRPDKQAIDWPTAVTRWRARATEHGLDPDVLTNVRAPTRGPRRVDATATRDALIGPVGLTAAGQTFTEADVMCALAAAAPEGARYQDLHDQARALLADSRVIPVGEPPLGRPTRATTREILTLENAGLAVAVRGHATHTAQADRRHAEEAITASPVTLTEEQQRVARAVATSANRVTCVIGRAGAGKTTAIATGARALENYGIPVVGAAPSAQAAHTLATTAGIEARTIHSLLADTTAGGVPEGGVVVVDEASMADTRTLTALLHHVEDRGSRVVLVGDPAQLPAVGPGGLFAALCDRHDPVRLDGNRRQDHEWERDALVRLRAGDTEAALATYAEHGRVIACEDPYDARARLVEDWWASAHAVGAAEAVMLAHRRTDVRALNTAARGLLHDAGQLTGPALTAGGREYQVGDRIVARTNNRRLGIRNGTRGTITHIDPDTGAIHLRTDDGTRLTLPHRYAAASLDHAYALTVHAAQGATVTHAHVLASDQSRIAEWGYVALTRARRTTHLYVLDTSDTRTVGALEPALPGPTIDDLTQTLRNSAAEPLATDQAPHPPSPPHRAHEPPDLALDR